MVRLGTRVGTSFAAGALAFACVALALPRDAAAKTVYESPYSLEQTFNSAVRLVRVDLGFKIVEKDQSAGYLTFEYKSYESGSRAVPASIEMVDTGRNVKVVVQISQMARYHEQSLTDSLRKKLRDEYGDPAPRAPSKPDAGDGDGDAGEGD